MSYEPLSRLTDGIVTGAKMLEKLSAQFFVAAASAEY
jgi:hypothetical protein